jgi:hypothetical protein
MSVHALSSIGYRREGKRMNQVDVAELIVYALVLIGVMLGARWLYVLAHRQSPKALRRYSVGIELHSRKEGSVTPLAEYVVIDMTDQPARLVERSTLDGERFIDVEAEIRRLCLRLEPEIVLIEVNGYGAVVYDHLSAEGLPVRAMHLTVASKRQLRNELQMAVQHGDLLLPTEHEEARAIIDMEFDAPLAYANQGVRYLEARLRPIQWTGPGRFA